MRPTGSAADYWETIRHLRPGQVLRLLRRRVLGRVAPARLPDPGVPAPARPRGGPLSRTPFLGYPPSEGFDPASGELHLVGLSRGHRPPVEWDRHDVPTLWLLESNYFHWLSPAIGYAAARPYLLDWTTRAPRRGRAQAWNPFGVGFRALQWTRLLDAWRGRWEDDPQAPALLSILWQQGRFLHRMQELEYLGNHLIKTAAGLFATGRFFAGAAADRWEARARRILLAQVREQVLPDGGHYERTPLYHLLVLLDVLDALNMCASPDEDAWVAEVASHAARMVEFAAECVDPDGEIPLLNDSVVGQAPAPAAVVEYASRVLGRPVARRVPGTRAFPDFGLFRIVEEPWEVWVDGGPVCPDFLPAHAHADVGTVLAWLGGRRLLVDSGTYCYGGNPARREADRHGGAHNVLLLDGEGCCRCWKDFRVGRRPSRVVAELREGPATTCTVAHDGFRRLRGRPAHERRVEVCRGRISIIDAVRFAGRAGAHRVELRWHLDPAVRVEALRRVDGDWAARLSGPGGVVSLSIAPADAVTLASAPVARRFHEDAPGPVVVAGVAVSGDFSIRTTFALG